MNLTKTIYENNTLPMLSHINVGFGEDVSIGELAQTVGKVVGYDGLIEFDSSKPDGSPRKLLDSSLLKKFGWIPTIDLENGLVLAYRDFLQKNS
jgi:GDP-L-fucose synthase